MESAGERGPTDESVPRDYKAQVEVAIKYGGYIERQLDLIERSRGMEDARVPDDFDYMTVHGLSNEVREKLLSVRPRSLGQASRISGVTPAALSLLAIHLRRTASA
jgi:tRNA uridine 5-carboxymethylaminomethyl modification enzyme